MTLTVRRPFSLVAIAITFLAALALFALVNRGPSPAGMPANAPEVPSASPYATDARIDSLQRAAEAEPADATNYTLLGDAYLQKARESGDPAFYDRADGALHRALRLDPRSPGATAGLGSLALARHDFHAALRHGLRARRLAPHLVAPYGVVADALVELGRYEAAEEPLQRMVDLKPGLASYARVSYFRELHGDLGGAVTAVRLAASAGGGPENAAYIQSLLGDLQLQRGRLGAARAAYHSALDRFPSHVPARAGLARAAAARGDLGQAIHRYREVVDRLPLPEHVVALGEAELAAGRARAARRDLALVPAQQRLQRASGVNVDVEAALFEANHGDPDRAVELARAAWRRAPSVRSADALGWALTRTGRPRAGLRLGRHALALGSRDSSFLYHAGMSARAAGKPVASRELLQRALATNPRFSPLYAPRARRALEAL